ncbi:hypothetical protein CLOP_g24953 [Closterium sp. NIES-67]|nr:hypothetical protein CLOP_g24953 [Closterium sp. NIES-67]
MDVRHQAARFEINELRRCMSTNLDKLVTTAPSVRFADEVVDLEAAAEAGPPQVTFARSTSFTGHSSSGETEAARRLAVRLLIGGAKEDGGGEPQKEGRERRRRHGSSSGSSGRGSSSGGGSGGSSGGGGESRGSWAKQRSYSLNQEWSGGKPVPRSSGGGSETESVEGSSRSEKRSLAKEVTSLRRQLAEFEAANQDLLDELDRKSLAVAAAEEAVRDARAERDLMAAEMEAALGTWTLAVDEAKEAAHAAEAAREQVAELETENKRLWQLVELILEQKDKAGAEGDDGKGGKFDPTTNARIMKVLESVKKSNHRSSSSSSSRPSTSSSRRGGSGGSSASKAAADTDRTGESGSGTRSSKSSKQVRW